MEMRKNQETVGPGNQPKKAFQERGNGPNDVSAADREVKGRL